MELTPAIVAEKAEEYATEEPLYTVEAEHLESLGEAFAAGDFGWRDAEWVVQWYYRRYLGAVPNRERRSREDAYDENEYEAVRDALTEAAAIDEVEDQLVVLMALEGVDVPVASGFLMYLDPADRMVVGDREWAVLHDAGEIDASFPEPVTPGDYATYLATCHEVADRCDCSLWALYRAVWRLWKDTNE